MIVITTIDIIKLTIDRVIMAKRTFIEHLNTMIPNQGRRALIENKVSHLISSIDNVIDLIESNYTPEEADELVRRLNLSIKNRKVDRFTKGLDQIEGTDDE